MKQILKQQEKEYKRKIKNSKKINKKLEQIEENIKKQKIRQQLKEQKEFNNYINKRQKFIDLAIQEGFYNTANDLLKYDSGQIISDIINQKITKEQIINIINLALKYDVIKPIQVEILQEKINNL